MKLSKKEYDAMQSGWRKWINRNLEIKGFRGWGMDFEGKDILEIGCGSGYSASLITKENPKSYTGIDIMPEQLAKAEALNLPNAHFFQGDVSDLSRFEDNSFDMIVDFMILHHVEGWRSFLDEAFRVLRPGGEMYINDLTRKGVHMTDFFFHWEHAEEPLFTIQEFGQKASESGLITVEKINYAGLDFCFKFQKPAV
ncbi:MAG: class I SAM-dependent methyltransferase [Lachnospiraceae bacterium]|nr:class I SAM-dependent methyltransferase [Lachnospiraceae bacterium]